MQTIRNDSVVCDNQGPDILPLFLLILFQILFGILLLAIA